MYNLYVDFKLKFEKLFVGELMSYSCLLA
jgi:hypothetical protein